MSNYPPGVTTKMIDKYFGGPEDKEVIVLPLCDGYGSIGIVRDRKYFYFNLYDENDRRVSDFYMPIESARQLILEIERKL